MNNFFDQKNAERMGKLLLLIALFAALYIAMKFVDEVRNLSVSDQDITKVATINVTGTGTAFAIPDIANESFTVEEKASSIQDAETQVSTKANAAITFLKNSGVAEKDIQTTDYSANPDYSTPPPCNGGLCPAATSEPTILGYTVSETVTAKIRDTSAVGKIVDGLTAEGVTGLSGPDFTVDDPDTVNDEAQASAISDAKQNASALAQSLGVRLVRIVNFSENSDDNYPMPMFAATGMAAASPAAAPVISPGQNKYTSNVTITYEIE